MEIDFYGKVAFVTGAAGGIGLAVARMFAESGAKVAMTDIDDARLKQSAEDLKSKGFDILPIVCDISDEAQTKERLKELHGISEELMRLTTMWAYTPLSVKGLPTRMEKILTM